MDLLAKTTSGSPTGEKNGARGFRLNKDSCAHLYPTAKLTSHMSEKPVLGNGETGMSLKSLDQTFPVPDADCSVRKCCGAHFSGKGALYTAQFILHILRLLAEGSFATIGPDALDRVSNA